MTEGEIAVLALVVAAAVAFCIVVGWQSVAGRRQLEALPHRNSPPQ